MAKFNYKKWVTENKYGKLNEQGVADFEENKKDKDEESTKSENAKPDYIDLDKDGDKEESMKKAAKDKKEKEKKKDEGKEETKDEGKEETKDEGKEETKDEGKEETKDEGAYYERSLNPYTPGRTQVNGKPLLPEQIFGMQHSSKPPKQEEIDEMMGYYEQMGCEGLQKMYAEYYYENKNLMSEMNNTGPYEGSNIMQEGDDPEKQGMLVSRMNYISELAPTGCNEMAKIQEINGNFNLHENKKTKITKKKLVNIIKEELKKSLLKEQRCQPPSPCGEGFVWSFVDCKCVSKLREQTPAECQQIQAISSFMMCCENTSQWTTPMSNWSDECKNVYGQASAISSGYAECCSGGGTSTGHDDPNQGCEDPEIGRQCWYCKSPTSTPGCIQVINGNIPWSNPFPLPLYMNQQDCMDAEGCPEDDTGTGTGPTGDMKRCECCDKFGNPVSMQTQISASDSCVGTENTVYAGLGVYGCNEQGATQCKKVPTGDLPSGETPMMAKKASDDVEKSRELREMINKELFKK